MTLSVWWCGVVHGVNVKFSKFHVLFWSGNTGAIHDYNSTLGYAGTLCKANFRRRSSFTAMRHSVSIIRSELSIL